MAEATAFLFGLAPGGVYPAVNVAINAVRSYRTISTLPLPKHLGGIFSVALSIGLRLPGVTWHLARWSPDFPRRPDGRRDCLAGSGRMVPLRDTRGLTDVYHVAKKLNTAGVHDSGGK